MSSYEGTGELIALCPTRGNPERALRMVESFYDTVQRIGTELILVIDEDEPREAEYRAIPEKVYYRLVGFGVQRPDPPRIMVVPGGSLTKATNEAVALIVEPGVESIIGHIGDDHIFRTIGWDNAIRDALLAAPGVAYAWDGHSSCWASAWWTNASVIRSLGWLALPGSMHLTIDDAFMDIGAGTRLTFLSDVLIEHAWDKRSVGFYESSRRSREQANYQSWLADGYQADIDKLRILLGLEPQVFDTRNPPGSTFRRDWKLENGYSLGRDEPQPTWAELEEIAGRKLVSASSSPYLKARREWFRIARAAAGV